jgi:RsiW-degrading membrane proteinase PrsW (M82 family)
MYSSSYYNGIATGDIYFTRFISCVALHAAWTASVGVLAAQNQAGLNSEGSDWIFNILLIIGVPVVLHGLYDTLLKRDMEMIALAVAVASFAWLAIVIERARATDDDVPYSRRLATAMA